MNLVRLQKIIADRGYCSRRKAEEYIQEGKVFVDNKLVNTLGEKFDEDTCIIKVNGVILNPIKKDKYTYLLLNKPVGVITTMSDDRNRKTVADLIPPRYGRLFPVGRLDINTSGIIFMTDDGDFANLVTHPSSSFTKTYLVLIDGQLTQDEKNKLENGVILEDGITAPAKVTLRKMDIDKTIFEIQIHEGRNRQVRRMVEAINHNTLALRRIKIGPVSIGDLQVGAFRELDNNIIDQIKQTCRYNKQHNTYKKN